MSENIESYLKIFEKTEIYYDQDLVEAQDRLAAKEKKSQEDLEKKRAQELLAIEAAEEGVRNFV